MRHGCYKLCPQVREQLRKAREAEGTSNDRESRSYERFKGVAGPSGVRRKGSKDDGSSDEAKEKRKQGKKRIPIESYESLKDGNRERKKQDELDEKRSRKKERNGEKERKRKPETENRRDHNIPGPSGTRRQRKGDDSNKNGSDNRPSNRHDNCDRNRRSIDENVGQMKDEKRQETFDEYIINKGRCYFEDLCNCNYLCLIDQLWKDPFVTSTIASAALFAIGLKLCSELDGWRIIF